MIKECYIDGCAFERAEFPEGLYVYRTIVTLGHRALCLDACLGELREAAEELLHGAPSLDVTETDHLISDFLRRNGYPAAMPAYVELRCYLSGEVVLLGGEVSPYPQLGMRLLMPAGATVTYDLPLSECRSSVSRAVGEAARAVAEKRGAKVAVRLDRDGFVHSADEAELFVIKEYTIMTPRVPQTVEGVHVLDAIRRAGLQLQVCPISQEVLSEVDEIFYADHRGITALGSINGTPLMHILAEKIGAHYSLR